MKRLLIAFVLALSMIGCQKTVTAPVPGSINTFDATMYRALADAQAAINSFKADVQAGKVTETPAVKTALNQVITDYNAANALYQAYHASAGQTPTAQVQGAVTKVQVDINGLVSGGLQ